MAEKTITVDPVSTGSSETKAAQRATWAVLSLALAVRLVMLWDTIKTYPHDWLFSRGIEMGFLANTLLHGQGYSSPFGGSTGPTAFIAPGFPTLVAGVFYLFGSNSFASEIVVISLNIGFNLMTIWLMMYVARKTLNQLTATIAGTFWAISLPLIWMPTIFWETNISACVLIGMIAAAWKVRKCPTKSMWALFGASCGVIALINPALLPALVLVMAWIAFQTWESSRSGIILGLLTLTLVFSPWPIRNAYRFHAFIPLRSTVGFELWMGNREGATGYLDESLFPMYNQQELASYISKGEVAYTQGKSDEAKSYIVRHPGTFVMLTLRRIVRFWTGTGNVHGSPVYATHATLTAVLGFIGLWLLFRRRQFALASLFLLPMLAFPLPYYITHAEFRYRLNLDPVMTVLAAFALTQIPVNSDGTWKSKQKGLQDEPEPQPMQSA